MQEKTLMIVGAGGDVGQGVAAAALQSGRRVVACGRSGATLETIKLKYHSDRFACVAGSIESESQATQLWERAQEPFGKIGDVVISVNSNGPLKELLDWQSDELCGMLAANLMTHFIAARTFIPRLPRSGVFLGIGGGTADFIFPGMAPISIAQAGLRVLYRALGKECREGPDVRELMIVSMVNGASSRARAKPEWLTDEEVGRHVCAILDAPECFPDAILEVRSREQVGVPAAPA